MSAIKSQSETMLNRIDKIDECLQKAVGIVELLGQSRVIAKELADASVPAAAAAAVDFIQEAKECANALFKDACALQEANTREVAA